MFSDHSFSMRQPSALERIFFSLMIAHFIWAVLLSYWSSVFGPCSSFELEGFHGRYSGASLGPFEKLGSLEPFDGESGCSNNRTSSSPPLNFLRICFTNAGVGMVWSELNEDHVVCVCSNQNVEENASLPQPFSPPDPFRSMT